METQHAYFDGRLEKRDVRLFLRSGPSEESLNYLWIGPKSKPVRVI
jgi:hypothetical protein